VASLWSEHYRQWISGVIDCANVSAREKDTLKFEHLMFRQKERSNRIIKTKENKWRKGAYLILNTAITAKNRNYLWYRDYRDNRHLDDSTIVRFGIAIYRDNRQYRAPLTQEITAWLLASSQRWRVPSINSPRCKTASRLHLLHLTPFPRMKPPCISAYTL